MSNRILGKGWKFPLTLDSNGSIAISEYNDSIRDSVILILSTKKGERVMNPDFGCGIHDYVFEIVNITTISRIKASIQDALRIYEPRIIITNITVSTADIKNGRLLISIDYEVIRTNNQFNIVYPFYLTEGS
jgi:phage baseplate assembly protein W